VDPQVTESVEQVFGVQPGGRKRNGVDSESLRSEGEVTGVRLFGRRKQEKGGGEGRSGGGGLSARGGSRAVGWNHITSKVRLSDGKILWGPCFKIGGWEGKGGGRLGGGVRRGMGKLKPKRKESYPPKK